MLVGRIHHLDLVHRAYSALDSRYPHRVTDDQAAVAFRHAVLISQANGIKRTHDDLYSAAAGLCKLSAQRDTKPANVDRGYRRFASEVKRTRAYLLRRMIFGITSQFTCESSG